MTFGASKGASAAFYNDSQSSHSNSMKQRSKIHPDIMPVTSSRHWLTRLVGALALGASPLLCAGSLTHLSLGQPSDAAGITSLRGSAQDVAVSVVMATNPNLLAEPAPPGSLTNFVLYEAASNRMFPITVAGGQSVAAESVAMSANGRWLLVTSLGLIHPRMSKSEPGAVAAYLIERNTGLVWLVNHLPGQPDVVSKLGIGPSLISDDGERVYFANRGGDLTSDPIITRDGSTDQVDLTYVFDRSSGQIRMASDAANSANFDLPYRQWPIWISATGDEALLSGLAGTVRFQFSTGSRIPVPDPAGQTIGATFGPLVSRSGNASVVCIPAPGAIADDGNVAAARADLVSGELRYLNPPPTGTGEWTGCAESVAMNDDASLIAFSAYPRRTNVDSRPQQAYLWSASMQQPQLISHAYGERNRESAGHASVYGLSPDGNQVLLSIDSDDVLANPVTAEGSLLAHYRVDTDAMQVIPVIPGPQPAAAVCGAAAFMADQSVIFTCNEELDSNRIDWNDSTDLFRWQPGTTARLISRRARNTGEAAVAGISRSLLAANGRWVGVQSQSRDYGVGTHDDNHLSDVFLLDTWTGRRTLVSRSVAGPDHTPNNRSRLEQISADGSVVIFNSEASDLDSDFQRPFEFLGTYSYQRDTGAIRLLNRTANNLDIAEFGSTYAIAPDGSRVVYQTTINDQVIPGFQTNSARQLLLRSTRDSTSTLISVASGNGSTGANADVSFVAASTNLDFVVFHSAATNLGVSNPPTTGLHYLADTRTRTVVPLETAELAVIPRPHNPEIPVAFFSGDGQFLFFASASPSFATPIEPPGSTSLDCFRLDLTTRTWLRITSSGGNNSVQQRCTATSANGQQVLYERQDTDANNLGQTIWKFDLQASTEVQVLTYNYPVDQGIDPQSLEMRLSPSGDRALITADVRHLIGSASASPVFGLFLFDFLTTTSEWLNPEDLSTGGSESELLGFTANTELTEIVFRDRSSRILTDFPDRNGTFDAFLYRTYESFNNVGMSGLWTEPGNEGQGFQLVPLPATGQMLVSWYTYRTDTQSGTRTDQRWMLGLGNVVGDTVQFNLSAADDGVFDSNPAGAQVPRGTLTIRMQSCLAAEAQYQLNAEGGNVSGTIPLARISNDSVCQSFRTGQLPALADDTTASNVWRVAHNGAWHNPAKPGQGLILDVSPQTNQLVATWFTFDSGNVLGNGRQAPLWLAAVGTLDGSSSRLNVFESKGGRLDAPNTTVLAPVGTLDLTPTSCNTLSGQYQLQLGGTSVSGSLPLERITPAPVDC